MPAVGAAIASTATFLASGTPLALAANTALLLGTSFVSQRLLAQDLKQGTQPRDIVVRSGSQPKIIVYGEAVVGGALAYMNQIDVGNDDFELWAVVVHAAHEVDGLDDVYYETDLNHGGTEINWTTNNVVSGPWYAENSSGEHAAKIWRELGTDTQTVNTDLRDTFADITDDFRLRGYCYTVHRWRLWQESEEIFKGGQPQNIRAKIRGKKIYDPKLDTSPGANPDNALYFAWSQNPILIAVDYMRNYWTGGGIPADRFDWDDIVLQADICTDPVDTPSGQQERYTCNGAIDLGAAHDENLEKILACCLGQRVMSGGLIQLKAGGLQVATVSLDESDIIGRVVVRTAVPRDDRYNKVTGTYISEDAEYIETDFIPVDRGGLYVSRDNGEIIDKTIKLDLVTNEYQAQRIAWKHLNASDQQQSIEVPLRWSGMRLTPGTYVNVTYPKFNWTNKLFRCQSLKIGESGIPVTAVLEEDASSAWSDPLSGDYATRTQEGQINKPDNLLPVPVGMTAKDGPGFIEVEWTNPSRSRTWDYIEVWASPDNSWANAVLVGDRVTAGQFNHGGGNNPDPVVVGDQRWYWVRAIRNGQPSLREPNSDTSDRTATVLTEGAEAGLNLISKYSAPVTATERQVIAEAPTERSTAVLAPSWALAKSFQLQGTGAFRLRYDHRATGGTGPTAGQVQCRQGSTVLGSSGIVSNADTTDTFDCTLDNATDEVDVYFQRTSEVNTFYISNVQVEVLTTDGSVTTQD